MTEHPLVTQALASKLPERFTSACVARSYQALNSHRADIYQESVLGIMHAAENFDPSRGVTFETHAWWWARSYVTTYLRRSFGCEAPAFAAGNSNEEDTSAAERIPAPSEIEATEDRLDAPKVWRETLNALAAPPNVASIHHTPEAAADRLQQAEIFLRNAVRGESFRAIAKDKGVSFQRLAHRAEYMREKFKRLFPQAHEALNS